ncbi:MAG: 2-oxoglutarate dehydrogenase E1 component, partial [Marinobacter sp. 34-60-7]
MHESIMEQLWQTSHLQGGNLAYVEQLFETYLTDPNAIPEEWRSYFDKLPGVEGYNGRDVVHSTIRDQFEHISRNQRFLASGGVPASATSDADKKQIRVLQLINAYRFRGHQESKLDPLGVWQRQPVEDLDPSFHELGQSDLDLEFQTGSLNFGSETMKLGDIVDGLRQTYCGSIGAEYMHVVDTRIKRWFQQRMEPVRSRPEYEANTRKHILERLTAAEGLEKYLGSRYPGVKRFGL